ncbi:extracellular solute-binding protein (plasmid) [Herbiconiux sp. KACC 21604]|uniref:ABC transporter substrate-binding protein n=1 Tax=unclassified Herbiconiux TaxID=2618217 RepID=UPI0014923DB1|nr:MULTISPECIES: extracellular solute-binding protein [unclassified Herbiconiux]QJU56335.1 extracellular solute-binding protein [Herbiconiux sp. SALV-R1]WPO88842.1 extracellular solute-binding protein [Herbiconiux sp. KACC 21604]
MINKRWGLALASAAMASLLLAGCSDTSTSDPSSDGPVTISYWDFLDPSQDNPRSNALKENIANFEAANPNITVDLSVVSLGDMLNRLPQAAAAGQAPDVFKMFTPQVPQMAAAGAYAPLPEAASQITDWLRPTDALEGPDGKQVAVPYEYRTCALYYNQKILDQIGATVPTTYDEVVDVAGKAAAAGYTGFGTGFSDTDNSAIISTFFDCFMSQVDQEIWNGDGDPDFATEKGAEFGDFLADLRDAGGMGTSVVSDSYSTVTDGLTNGTVAMAVLGSERVVTLATGNPDVKWTSLPMASTGDTKGSTFGWTLGMGNGTKNADAAWKFIEYMTGPEAGAVMATGGEVPTREATYEQPFFSTPEADTVNKIADYVENESEPHTYSDDWIAIATGLANAGQQLYLNGISGSEFIKAAQDAASK